jgi:histidyl-tRNA synthetase
VLLQALRNAGVDSELYPDPAKMKKQLKHASDLGVQFVAMRGEQERSADVWTLRDMSTGDQVACTVDELLNRVI